VEIYYRRATAGARYGLPRQTAAFIHPPDGGRDAGALARIIHVDHELITVRQVIPSVVASRAPLSFGGVPAILAHFAQVAQSFARGKLF
jgi:hypothetical protein